jgi:hypothetical protein
VAGRVQHVSLLKRYTGVANVNMEQDTKRQFSLFTFSPRQFTSAREEQCFPQSCQAKRIQITTFSWPTFITLHPTDTILHEWRHKIRIFRTARSLNAIKGKVAPVLN